MQVQGASDPMTGARTEVFSTVGGGAEVDFGYVAAMGPQPRNGMRVETPNGEARYVATLEVVVQRNGNDGFTVSSYRPGMAPGGMGAGLPTLDVGSIGPSVSMPGLGTTPDAGPNAMPLVASPGNDMTMRRPGTTAPQARGGYYVPPNGTSVNTVQHVDLYVRLAGVQSGGQTSVWFAPADMPLTADNPGQELTWGETLAATAVPIGQPFRCQLSLAVPPSEWGHQSAHVSFSARPSMF